MGTTRARLSHRDTAWRGAAGRQRPLTRHRIPSTSDPSVMKPAANRAAAAGSINRGEWGCSGVRRAHGQMDFHHHVSWWFDRHPQMAAALSDEPLEGPEVYSWFFGREAVRSRFGRPGAKLELPFPSYCAFDFRDRDHGMRTLTDVGVLRDEPVIHDDCGQFY